MYRVELVIAAVLLGVVSSSPGRELADVSFGVMPTCDPHARGELAVSIYKTGVVARVDADDERRGWYRVFIKQRGNLVAIESVRRMLDDEPCVTSAHAVTGFFR